MTRYKKMTTIQKKDDNNTKRLNKPKNEKIQKMTTIQKSKLNEFCDNY